MENKIEQLWKEVFGNGNEGLKVDVVKVKQILKDMKEREEKMDTALSGINRFVTEVDTEYKRFASEICTKLDNIEDRYKNDKKRTMNNTSTIILIIGICLSVLLSILSFFL